MTRPADWSPLAASDPIGGDVAAVQVEANYYAGLAQEISDQVARLRRIASEGEQIGKTAEKLRSSAGDTADKLAQTHGRVQSVGSALTAWVPHLQAAQDDTLAALRDAQNAQAEQQANHPPAAGSPPPTSDADKQAAASRAQRYSEASAGLAAARRRFEDAIAERDRQASGLAGQIRDALHDGLKDGFWDHISNWVSQHIGMIKMVVTVLTWVATAVAIACIFIPGLNILAIALTVGLLAAHTLLAATGNGSWLDVAIDVAAIATLGMSRLAGTAAEEAETANLVRSGSTLGDAAEGGGGAGGVIDGVAEDGGSGARYFGPAGDAGPLAEVSAGGDQTVADTFRTNTYWERETTGDETWYRAYAGDGGNPYGSYWTDTEPSGPLQTQLDSALNPGWNPSPDTVISVKPPAGVTYYDGYVGEQPVVVNGIDAGGELLGGGRQIYLPPGTARPEWAVGVR